MPHTSTHTTEEEVLQEEETIVSPPVVQPPKAILTSEPAREQTQLNIQQISEQLEAIRQQALRIQEAAAKLPETEAAVPEPPKELVLSQPGTDRSQTIFNPDINRSQIQDLINRGFEVTSGELPSGITAQPFPRVQIGGIPQEQADSIDDQLNSQLRNMLDQFDKFQVQRDATSAALIESIKLTFSARKLQMQDINKRRLGAQRTIGIRRGSRFTPELETDILSDVEARGIARLGELDAQEATLLVQAQQAKDAEDFKLLNTKMDLIRSTQKQRQEMLQKQLEMDIDVQKLMLNKQKEARLQESFAFDQQETVGELAALSLAQQMIEQGITEISSKEAQDVFARVSQQLGIDQFILQGKVAERLADLEKDGIKGTVVKSNGRNLLINPFTGEIIKDLGRSDSPVGSISTDFPNISAQDQLNALALAVDRYGKRNGAKMLPIILQAMSEGKTLDDIDDEIRLSEVSEEFTGVWKDSFEFVTKKGFSTADRLNNRESFDRILEIGDNAASRDFLLGLARDGTDVETRKQVTGRDDALSFLDLIEVSLNDFIAKGGKIGLIAGNMEKLKQKVFRDTGDEELAIIANEIAIAVQAYRKSITGAAFTPEEAKEYAAIYPDIRNSKELNAAKITSLKKVFGRFQTNFYRRALGLGNYDRLFDDTITVTDTGLQTVRLKDETGTIRVFELTQEQLQSALADGLELVQ